MDTLDFRQNEAKYSGVFQHLNDAIFIHDLEGHFLDVNETACERLGYNKEELLRMTPSDIDTHEFAVKVPERIKELQKKGRLIFETAHITKDGRVIPIELSSTIIQFEDKPAILSIARDISERKRMQEELKESEEKYRLISEHANDLITIFNSRLEYEYINKEPHFRILGYSKDDLIGKSISEFLYPDDFKHPFTSYDYDFESIGRELRFKRKDGTYIWLEVRGRTFISKEKEIKVILIWREISERKESEGVVLESEEKFRTIAEQSLMGIAIVQDNLIKYVNYAISKISGYSISQMTGWTINDFMKKIYPEDLVFVLEQLSKKQLGDKDVVVNYPCRIISKSGEIKWIDLYSKSIIFKGRLADMITFIDITEKMNVEQQLKESEEKYRLLSENSLDLITVLDDKFKVEYFNIETQKRVLGVAIHNAIVNRELGQIHPDDFETAIKLIKKCFDTNEPVTGEIRLKHIDGHYIWFECKANTFFDREGEKKLLIISRDITERKQTEEKLRESEEKFRTITEQSLMGICIVQNNSIKYANEAMSEIVEYAISEMMEWKPNDLFRLIVPENLSYAKEEAKILQERKRKGITHDRYRILTKSGTLKWVDTYAKSIKFQEKNAALVTFIDATKRIEAEQKLRESEEKFRETLDLLPDIVFEANTNLDLYYANQVAFEKFGYNKEEFENGLNISQMIAPVALEKAVNQVKKILNGENLGPDDILLRKKDDSEFWGRINSRPIYKDGRIIGIRGVISDVTKRKKAEQKLKQSKLITDNLDEALIIFDKDGFVPFINPAYENLTGYKSSEIIGKNGVEVAKKTILQSELDKVLKAFRKALKGEELPPISTYFKHKDGNEIPIEFKTSFVRDQNGDPIQIVAVINDITERKKAEHQLKESEKKYRLITENVNDMISVLNNRFKFEYINSQVHQRIIGYQEDELVSRDALNLIHPKDQQIALNALKRGFKEGEGGGEFRFKHRNGSYIWLETKGKTFVDIDGNEKALLVSREITERKKAEQLLRESEERYRSYIENFYGIAYRGRMDWVPLFFHGAVEEITGYTEEEFLNGNPRWDQIIDEEDFGLLEDNFSDIRSIPNFLCEREYKIIRKDGEIRW
ncbi:MAG: PAS domain S-box protein, partial [Promethearchaeota archaeon]